LTKGFENKFARICT